MIGGIMKACARCGRPRQRGHRFCPGCGAPFDAADANPLALRERKYITVLFADLCGSTAQVAKVDPEEAQAYLDRALRLMTEAVEAYGGTLSQLLGDGLLALFGAPIAQEDHAMRACLAAIAMQQRLRSEATSERPMEVRVGINSGEAIVGSVSEYLSSHYRADGSTIHVAARIEQIAQPGTAVMSGATFRLVCEQIETRALGAHPIRGLDGDVELYEIVVGAQRSAAAPLARRRQLVPLVGRNEALAALNAAAQQVRTGHLRAVGLRGEAGIGKSRLMAELSVRLRAEGFVDCAVAARAYASHIPYGLMSDLMRVLMCLPGTTDAPRRREAAELIVAGWPEAERRHWAAVVDLLDLGDPGDAWLVLTPAQRRRRIADTVHWLLSERLSAGPVVLAIDDILLADRDSLRLLESLVRRLEHQPLLICTTYRQEFVHHWMDAAWFTEQWVGPLSHDETTQLARTLLGDHASLRAVVPALVERADGNPFFLEQMAMTLIDEGTLVGLPGAYRCVRLDSEPGVPASITAVIGARIDRLPPAAKACLEAAAILGEPVSAGLVAAVQRIDADEADNHLRHALSCGLLVAEAGASERYTFRHGLVQEVVVAALTRPRRKLLHRAALAALRSQVGEQPADRPAVLAHHAYSGEAWAEAAEFALPAMSRSIARSANRDALRVFELGLDAARRLDADPAMLPLELGLRMEALGALLPLGRMEDIVANLEHAEQITQTLGDTRRQAAVLQQLAVIQWTRGNYQQGLAAAANAAEAAVVARSRSLQMAAMQARMMLNHGLGRYADAVADAAHVEGEFAAELKARRLLPGWAVIAVVNLQAFSADLLACRGDFEAAQRMCDAAYAELATQDHAFSRVLVDFVQAGLWMDQHRHEEAVPLLQAALQCCRLHDVPTMDPPIRARLGGALARSGRAAEALELLEAAIAQKASRIGGRYNEFYFPFNLAIARAEAGQIDGAAAAAADAWALAASFEQRGHEAQAIFLLAQVEAAAGRDATASTHFAEALALAEQCAMPVLVQQVLACRGVSHA
jgi:predicted ATPase/class 3 adenylate cyclase